MAKDPIISHADIVSYAFNLLEQGQLDAAEKLLSDVLRANARQFDALVGLGVLNGMRGKNTEAVKHLMRAVRLDPRSEMAQYNLGQAQLRLGRHEAAVEALRAAAAVADRAPIHEKLGDAVRQLGRLEEAARHYVRAVELDPANSLALSSAVETLRKICAWDRLDKLEAALVAAAAAGAPVEPLLLQHVSDDPALQRKATEAYWQRLIAPTAPPQPALARRKEGRLRIGYLSADFRQHPMVSVIAEAMELHDRAAFEIVGLSYGLDDASPQRRRMEKAFERFIDLNQLGEAQMAQRIAQAGIDILVDLAGYTANARLGVVAARPAPIVCHYMGFPGTLGSRAYDYLIADGIVAPAGSETHYTEALVRLPTCYWALDRKRDTSSVATTRATHGLPQDAIVLSSFNGQQKLSPRLIGAWSRVLAAAPSAVLWLFADNAPAAVNLKREAIARGIPENRLVMTGRLPPQQHLARVGLADLMLDSMPYGGHTTVCDALWLGVPAITVEGRAFASRVGASLLTHAGLPELITQGLAEYETLAVALANDPPRLAALRTRLATRKPSAPLFDTPHFVRAIELAYREMWKRHTSGLPPQTLDLAGHEV